MALGASGALAAPPTVKPPYRHQGECELEPERMAGSLAVLEVGQQARGRKLFLRVGLGGCGTLVAPVQGSLGKSPAAQGDPEQGGRRGLGGQAEGEPGVPQLIPSSPLYSQCALLQQLNSVDFSRL